MSADSEEAYVEIRELELLARVGVPDDERAQLQRLTISIMLWPRVRFSAMRDDIANAVDYAVVARDLKELVRSREDKLIETLASAVADHLLAAYPVERVRIELRKFVLPDAKYTAVVLCRPRAEDA